MMPKATLLGTAGKDYILTYGRQSYFFKAGKGQQVPVPVALMLAKKTNRKGLPIFEIEHMPEIVEAEEVRIPEEPEQNVPVDAGQLTFEGLGHGSNH